MQVSWATSAGHPERPDHVNEDFVGAVADAVVLLDGAGIPGAEHLCHHGVEWYARRLGAALLAHLPGHGRNLRDVLSDAIAEVADLHRDTCAIEDSASPQAAVAVVRLGEGQLDVLVLGDCHVVVAGPGAEPLVVTDGREPAVRAECLAPLSGMPRGSVELDRAMEAAKAAFRARRNVPGGFWVAKDEPAAAREAVLATAPLREVTGVGLLSNGVTRLVDPYGVAGWPEVVRTLAGDGPTELVRELRAAEDGAARRDEDRDAPDDATAAWVSPGGQSEGPGRWATRLAR